MIGEKRPNSSTNADGSPICHQEAACLYALLTSKRSVSRRSRVTWFLGQLNKTIDYDHIFEDQDEDQLDNETVTGSDDEPSIPRHQVKFTNSQDISLISMTSSTRHPISFNGTDSSYRKDSELFDPQAQQLELLVTPNTRVIFLSKSIATSIILDLSPSVVSVSSQNGCVFLDSIFDALDRMLHLLIKGNEVPYSPNHNSNSSAYVLRPKVFISVIAYTPFVVVKNNQVLVQNRRLSSFNIDQILANVRSGLTRLVKEIQDLVSSTGGVNLEFSSTKTNSNVFIFPQPVSGGVIRHPELVLEDIYELGLFSSHLMPRLSRLSMVIISDGLLASTNNLNVFRLRSIAVSFISLSPETVSPDSCFGYTPYLDLMRFVAKTTQGFYLSHKALIEYCDSFKDQELIQLSQNPLFKLYTCTLHSFNNDIPPSSSPRLVLNDSVGSFKSDESSHVKKNRFFSQESEINSEQRNKFSKHKIDSTWGGCHDWRSLRHLERNLDADFEHVISCLLREGYLIKNIQLKDKESSWIVARLVLHWRHNLDLEYELTAQYWSNSDAFDLSVGSQLMLQPFNSTPIYGDTYCEITVHGSYSFLHNLCCDRRNIRRRSEYRETAYKQFKQLIDGVTQTHERLQYLSRFYRDPSLSKVPSFLSHGNSLLYEQPHTHKLTSTIENIMDENSTNDFQDYWQKISCLDNKIWKNLMHTHTLRLVLEHDQPKHKNIHCQTANGRYTHVQCRRALSSISTFIKTYASFALLEDTTYVRFISNREDELNQIETSATKGFIVIRINKLLPIVVIHLMFTSGILDSQRVQIVNYLEEQLMNCKPCNVTSSSTPSQTDNLLKMKTIARTSEYCCALIRSPLERMLKIYNRNFAYNSLLHNWTHGLPGSWPYVSSQPIKVTGLQPQQQQQQPSLQESQNPIEANSRGQTKGEGSMNMASANFFSNSDRAIHEYNLIYGKYLYGIRVVHTISDLPHEVIPMLISNVLSKISAITMNMHIKQGFHIAFNNSGILNLVLELGMRDTDGDDQPSNCLCQCIVLPPVSTTSPQYIQTSLLNGVSSAFNSSANQPAVQSGVTLSSSYTNSDPSNFPMDSDYKSNNQVTIGMAQHIDEPLLKITKNGELKLTREYWIEKKFGMTCESDKYHKTLHQLSYSQVVDQLFTMDNSVFNCLFAYELLQLMCDKQSANYNLDIAMSSRGPRTNSISMLSPTTSINSSTNLQDNSSGLDQVDGGDEIDDSTLLPSSFICGRSGLNPRIPLLELDYQFSIARFLDRCQQAAIKVLLFRDHSQFYGYPLDEPEKVISFEEASMLSIQQNGRYVPSYSDLASNLMSNQNNNVSQVSSRDRNMSMRKVSVDVLDSDANQTTNPNGVPPKREHRLSGHQEFGQLSASVASASLNHLFLDTLHKRLKQMHDKEIQISDVDRQLLPNYLVQRCMVNNQDPLKGEDQNPPLIDWRCFLRKGNQENMMIVLIPASLLDVVRWLNYISALSSESTAKTKLDSVCPIFVFRCSSSMINDHLMKTLSGETRDCRREGEQEDEDNQVHDNAERPLLSLESDLSLHFGQPCNYMGKQETQNDELDSDISVQTNFLIANQTQFSDEKTLEHVHFRAFLRKIKNTVLKSRFSSLNEAYQNEIFINKEDILYYINNVDLDTQKKYHVSLQLRNLSDFIKSYQEYNESIPRATSKNCNQLLNSILLQKCGLFINQPIARFDESDPLIKQLHDRKLLFLMRCNYKVELPILSENLDRSSILKKFLSNKTSGQKSSANNMTQQQQHQQVASQLSNSTNTSNTTLASSPADTAASNVNTEALSSSLSIVEGSKLMEAKYCSSLGATSGSLTTSSSNIRTQQHHKLHQQHYLHQQQKHQLPMPRFTSNSSLVGTLTSSWQSPADAFFLEAFRGVKYCSIEEIDPELMAEVTDVSSRHEAHLAEVLRQTGQRKESHQYRRVLKSKGNYSQSHGAIDQALRRVDSLGRLEHFCLTPLLFSPSWRSKLAPVRDHTIEQWPNGQRDSETADSQAASSDGHLAEEAMTAAQLSQLEAEQRWHQAVCNNYIKEYEQYIQTLGFNSVQIRYQSSSSKTAASLAQTGGSSSPAGKSSQASNNIRPRSRKSSKTSNNGTPIGSMSQQQQQQQVASHTTSQTTTVNMRRGSISTSNASLPVTSNNQATYNTGYLIKFLNSGCLVFKVGFCKPYVYSILYSIEGERFNNSNVKMNMTTFLDELDNIKVTMHLHSFTYDYHLRSMYSFISGRQMTFTPGYHLVFFLEDFIKYYQKAPNYARNHIICGELTLTDTKVPGRLLYNHIVSHCSNYNLEVLEMCTENSSTNTQANNWIASSRIDPIATTMDRPVAADEPASPKSGSDFVLCELKREKVRYRDGKDSDIFDCGLIITHHDPHGIQSISGCLTLKYYLVLTNQRELYPKLIHTFDSIISSSGCHRPIRFGTKELVKSADVAEPAKKSKKKISTSSGPETKLSFEQRAVGSEQSDLEEAQLSDLQSSGEASGPQSILSTSSSINWIGQSAGASRKLAAPAATSSRLSAPVEQEPVPRISVNLDQEASPETNQQQERGGDEINIVTGQQQQIATSGSSFEEGSLLTTGGDSVGYLSTGNRNRQRLESTNSSYKSEATGCGAGANAEPRAICDEEITYLGYFSSDEMDMLRFLREKTNNLSLQLERLVKMAETNYQRDHLWQKLMQRSFNQPASGQSEANLRSSTSSDELPLSIDELLQLLAVAEQVSLSSLDSQLGVFTTMPMNWYMKLMQSFADMKRLSSSACLQRIYIVQSGPSRHLLLYMQPRCRSAIILLSLEPERDSVKLSILLKDKLEMNRSGSQQAGHSNESSMDKQAELKVGAGQRDSPAPSNEQSQAANNNNDSSTGMALELDHDCRQLINDFVNFCATFMWSTLL